MPRASAHLAVNARVSVSPHFLRSSPVFETLRTLVALDAPGIRLHGVITEATTLNNRPAWTVKLDQLPDQPFPLLATSLRFEGQRPATRRTAPERTAAPALAQQESPDYMDDAVALPGEMVPLEDEEEELDLCWQEGEFTVDRRVASPSEAFSGRVALHLPAKKYASPAMYFLRFLPEVHIQQVVLPAINEHASTVIPNFLAITYADYLLWIALLVIMTVVRVDDHRAYWNRSDLPNLMTINFTEYMSMERFDLITKMHIFCRPDAARYVTAV